MTVTSAATVPSSPETRLCAINLACDYAAANNMPKALSLVTEVRSAIEAGLGADHPDTLVAANNLSCYLRCTGRLDEAPQAGGRHAGPDGRKLANAPADAGLRGQPGQLPGSTPANRMRPKRWSARRWPS